MANDFTKAGWCPDIPATREEKWRLRTAKFGDGYEERVLDGINALEEKWSVKFSNRSKETILSIDAFLKAVGANSFEFYERDTEETIEVVCDGWLVEWANKDSRSSLLGTVTIDLRRVFSHASPTNAPDYVLPTATKTTLGGIKSSASILVDPDTGIATANAKSVGAAPVSHTHTIADISGLQDELDPINAEIESIDAEIVAINKALDAKAPASHKHVAADLSGVVKTINGTPPDDAGNVMIEASAGDEFLPLAGGTLTGPLTVPNLNVTGAEGLVTQSVNSGSMTVQFFADVTYNYGGLFSGGAMIIAATGENRVSLRNNGIDRLIVEEDGDVVVASRLYVAADAVEPLEVVPKQQFDALAARVAALEEAIAGKLDKAGDVSIAGSLSVSGEITGLTG